MRTQRRRPAARGDAPARLADHARGDANQVPAGGALAVDRDGFSAAVTQALEDHPLITLARGEVAVPPADWDSVIVATGPLTSPALADAIRATHRRGRARLLRRHRADRASRLHRHERRLVPVALRQGRARRHRRRLHQLPDDARRSTRPSSTALLAGDKTEFKEWEASTPYFDGCLPIEVMAERGRETLRHGPMKPVGLTNPHAPDVKPYAVVQLRQDNKLGTLYNMVGFQTKLKHGEQARVFRTIPGLQNAEFARLGGLHRNTFLNSPKLLDGTLRLQGEAAAALRRPDHRLRGLCRDRAAIGLLAGRFAAAERRGERWRRRRRPRRTAPCSPTSPAAISRPSTPARARSSR